MFSVQEEITKEDTMMCDDQQPKEIEELLENVPPSTASHVESPNKRRTSPRKKVASTFPTKNSPFNVAKPIENVTDAIKDILANLAPPTDEETRAKRTPKAGPLVEIGNSSSKANSPAKMFPIFGKGFSENGDAGSAKKQAASTKRKLHLASTVNEDAKSGLKQAVIDAGQKKIGAEYCLLCDFVYTLGDSEEEKLHMEKHNHATGKIKFSGELYTSRKIFKKCEIFNFKIAKLNLISANKILHYLNS